MKPKIKLNENGYQLIVDHNTLEISRKPGEAWPTQKMEMHEADIFCKPSQPLNLLELLQCLIDSSKNGGHKF